MTDTRHIVYIIDDDEAVRTALSQFMDAVEVKNKTFSSAKEFLQQVKTIDYGTLVLDVGMPEMNGLELQQHLLDNDIWLPIIFITGHGDISMAVAAMKNGAVDFIEKPFNNDFLLERIEASFCLLDQRVHKTEEYDSAKDLLNRLTKREHEVLELLVAGNVNKLVASNLGISTRTVEVHRVNVMKKLEARSLADIVRLYMISKNPLTKSA